MFNSLRRRLLFGSACVALTAPWLAGCGTGSNPTGDTAGRLMVTVDWPDDVARLIPANTRSLKIAVEGNSAGLSAPAAQVLAVGVTTAEFPGLIPGAYTMVVGAFASTDGTGPLLALGADTNVVINAGNTTTVNISLVSQAVSVTVVLSPSTTDDVVTHPVTATLTAWSQVGGNGSVVPVDSSKVTWTSGTPAAANVQSAAGNGVAVTPVAGAATAGSRQVLITGRYLEAPVDLSGSATLTVNHATGSGVLDVNVSR